MSRPKMNGRTASRAIHSRIPITTAAPISTATRGEMAANRRLAPRRCRVDERGRGQRRDPLGRRDGRGVGAAVADRSGTTLAVRSGTSIVRQTSRRVRAGPHPRTRADRRHPRGRAAPALAARGRSLGRRAGRSPSRRHGRVDGRPRGRRPAARPHAAAGCPTAHLVRRTAAGRHARRGRADRRRAGRALAGVARAGVARRPRAGRLAARRSVRRLAGGSAARRTRGGRRLSHHPWGCRRPTSTPSGAAADDLLRADRLPRERSKGGGTVRYDLRPLLDDITVEPGPPPIIRARTRFHPELGTGRPEEVVAAHRRPHRHRAGGRHHRS